MRLLLDEMWTPTIALQMRKRGVDAIAISEPAYASRYAGVSDERVFAYAQDDARVVVTDNIADYEQARRDWESRGHVHHGLIYALNPPFNRHRGERVIGQMVNALVYYLSWMDAAEQTSNQVHYLREAPD